MYKCFGLRRSKGVWLLAWDLILQALYRQGKRMEMIMDLW